MFEEGKLREIEVAQKEWQDKYSERFKKERKREEEFVCDSGIPVKRIYTPLDLVEKDFDYMRDLGLPGEYPYTRGTSPAGYREELWHISGYTGHATVQESNKLWKAQIAAGISEVAIAYDLPTQLGYDPDHPRAKGEVGRVGVSLTSQRDWEIAFDGIDLEKIVVSQVANAMGAMGIANHLCLAERLGANLRTLKGSCQNDIIKEYLVRGNYIFPPAESLRLFTDSLAYCAQYAPEYHAITVCSLHYSESQSTPVHDAAFMLADAFCYIQAALDRGIDIDFIAPSIRLAVGHEHYGFFQEIAKLRAIRKIYARVLKERFKAKKPESLMVKIFIGQGGNSLQRQQYLNNIVRSAIATVVGALAGAQYINLRTYDEQFGIPSQEALVTNIRLQHVVAQETGITDTVDPLGGSYFVEWLTSEFEERIMAEIEAIDKLGGVVNCVQNGYMKRVIMQDAYQWQKDFESGKVIRVGANFYASEEEERPTTIYRADPKLEQARVAEIRELKRKRDNAKVKKALGEVKATASSPATAENSLMPPIMEAVENYATIGEMCDVLREVWGEYTEPAPF